MLLELEQLQTKYHESGTSDLIDAIRRCDGEIWTTVN
jgi:hypothetical protein